MITLYETVSPVSITPSVVPREAEKGVSDAVSILTSSQMEPTPSAVLVLTDPRKMIVPPEGTTRSTNPQGCHLSLFIRVVVETAEQ